MKRIMSLDDLCLFCEQNNINEFEAEGDTVVAVGIPASFSFKRDIDASELIPATIKACHDNINVNRSNIPLEAMEDAKESFKNRPILAEIVETEDGEFDFGGHASYKEKDGTIVYVERPVGIVPESSNPRIEYDEELKKNYLYVDGYIYEAYGNQTLSILERRGGNVDVSIEVGISKYSYDARKKLVNIEEFVFLGVTLLGEGVNPAMKGAHLELADFEVNLKDGLYSELNKNIQTQEKGGLELNKEKISELVAKYSVTELPFSDEELTNKTDEELENMFAEKFKKTEPEDEDPEDGDGDADPEDDEDEDDKDSYSITLGGEKRTYAISLNDKIWALQRLVNNVYQDDNLWYSVAVYDKELVMFDPWASPQKGYRQGYEGDDGDYKLVGERVEVFATWATKEEQAALDNMRTEYTAMCDKQINEARDAILNDETYSVMSESEDWKKLVEGARTYSVDELNVRAAALYGNYCKAQNKQEQKSAVKLPLKRSNRKTPYGSLF